jgi:hypothetical protein
MPGRTPDERPCGDARGHHDDRTIPTEDPVRDAGRQFVCIQTVSGRAKTFRLLPSTESVALLTVRVVGADPSDYPIALMLGIDELTGMVLMLRAPIFASR